MWLTPFFSSPNWEDAAASAITLAICCAWIVSVNSAVKQGVLDKRLSRKVVHIFTGPLFLLCWNLFSELPSAPMAAALVPFLITTQFLLTGLGVLSDSDTVASICRTGNPRELLYGPLFYGITFIVSTVLFWRHSPVGIVALMVLCGGDGFAEVVGRRYGESPSAKLPWSNTKSWPGTAAMFLGSYIFSFAFVCFFNACGDFTPQLSLAATALALLLVSLAATVTEAVCFEHADNVAVPLIAMIISWLALPVGEPRSNETAGSYVVR